MLIIFAVVVIICAIILGAIVLIQNPKGGGLSGSFGGLGNQLMGVKQTTDVLEKGTWVFAAIIGVLCIISSAFIPKTAGTSNKNDTYFNAPTAPVTPKTQATPVTPPPAKP